jgi:hypothetical protein
MDIRKDGRFDEEPAGVLAALQTPASGDQTRSLALPTFNIVENCGELPRIDDRTHAHPVR